MQENDSPQDYKPKSNTDLKAQVIQIVQEYLKTQGFSKRIIVDTPTDRLQPVNLGYLKDNYVHK